MIMDRKEQIEASNPYGNSSDFSAGKKIGFIIGAEWADEHPKELEGCYFCKQLGGINHKSDECYLSCDSGILAIDVDMPLTWGSATGLYSFDINYCPMCGRKLK